jgi:hypothetical protein
LRWIWVGTPIRRSPAGKGGGEQGPDRELGEGGPGEEVFFRWSSCLSILIHPSIQSRVDGIDDAVNNCDDDDDDDDDDDGNN